MPASLFSLPVELLRAIVLLAIPPVEAVSAYKERQKTLSSLIKTCRTLRAVARPLLWSNFRPFEDPVHLQRKPQLAHFVRTLHVKGGEDFARSLLENLGLMPNLQAVRVKDNGLSGLTIRKQDWLAFASANLTELTLLGITVSRASSRLRAISTFAADYGSLSVSKPRGLVNYASLPQLDMLQIRVDFAGPPPGLEALPCPVIVNLNLSPFHDDSLSKYTAFQHFQLDSSYFTATPVWYAQDLTGAKNQKSLGVLVRFVETIPSIRSFSLPFEFHPSNRFPPDRQQRRDTLVGALEKRHVKIIWRLYSKEEVDDGAVSREFWEYAKELKARKADGTEDGRPTRTMRSVRHQHRRRKERDKDSSTTSSDEEGGEPASAARPPNHIRVFLFMLLALVVLAALFFVIYLSSSSMASSASLSSFQSDCLAAHNDFRATHNAAALEWNNTLADAAKRWAKNCEWKHSQGSLLSGSYGENLFASASTAYKPNDTSVMDTTAGVWAWNNEESMYDYSKPTGFSEATAQVVWKSTTALGCFFQMCNGIFSSGEYGVYLVCEYFPAGNLVTDDLAYFKENVQAPS
ncbi:hypothetical protein JCM8097_001366 [Rhodosporidiobolus ruineniae]